MNVETAIKVIDRLTQAISLEINSIKSEIVGSIVVQVAVYSHDHIEANRPDFGVLSSSPSLTGENLDELEKVKAVLLDREQRRNALMHLKHLLEKGNPEAMQLLQEELQRFVNANGQVSFPSPAHIVTAVKS